jgi:hypothetical protein
MNDFLAETVSAGHFYAFKHNIAAPMPKHRDSNRETKLESKAWDGNGFILVVGVDNGIETTRKQVSTCRGSARTAGKQEVAD